MRTFIAEALVVLLVLTAWLATEPAKAAPTAEKIEQLIKQLGHDDFDTREKATRELVEIGKPAIPQLNKAVKDNNDPEVQRRAQGIVEKIKSSAQFVREALGDKDPKERKAAAEHVAERAEELKELLPTLIELIKDKDADVRDAATVAVAAIDPDNKAIAGSKIVKAMVSGKYCQLLRRIEVPGDKNSYTEFKDFGYYQATDYGGATGIPEGYWVYVYPHWYIWGKVKGK
jgi:HEAT repeat protein